MQFSVILPTRDRPGLFAEALASVQAQRGVALEIVIVNDGSAPAHDAAYATIEAGARHALGAGLQTVHLPRRAQGHGPSYAINSGVAVARGSYVAFLDDDDVWTDPEHLARAAARLAVGGDVYLTQQAAYLRGQPSGDALWLMGLGARLTARGDTPDAHGCFSVDVPRLMAHPGFAHLNTIIVRRALFDAIGGLDEGIRWEGDRDFYLRLIDAAPSIVFAPHTIARHNIPDPALTANITTATPQLVRLLSQLRVVDKAACLATHPLIRAHGRTHRAYVQAKVAAHLATAGDARGAAAYARAACAGRPRPGAALRAVTTTLRALMAR